MSYSCHDVHSSQEQVLTFHSIHKLQSLQYTSKVFELTQMGYVQRIQYGAEYEVICRKFNHSSPSITMRYLGIEDKEVQSILMNGVG